MNDELTREDIKKMRQELDYRRNELMPELIEEVKRCRAFGDLSENFEYRAARRAQGKTISRIRFLQKVLQHSRIIDRRALPKDRISLLSKVEFTHLGTNKKMTFTIVSHHEMNLEEGKLSCNSPIGIALMGRKAGEIVDVEAPAGKFQIRIDNVDVGSSEGL